MFIITAILSTRLLRPLKELHDIFFQPLIKIKVLVAAVFFQHHGYIDLTYSSRLEAKVIFTSVSKSEEAKRS